MLFTDNPRSYATIARIAEIPLGGIGPTRARTLRQLRAKLNEHELRPGIGTIPPRGERIPLAAASSGKNGHIPPLQQLTKEATSRQKRSTMGSTTTDNDKADALTLITVDR
jgi:hypothetical protein